MILDFVLGFILFVATLKSDQLNKDKATSRDIKVILNGVLPIFIAISLPIVIKLNLAVSIAISIILVIILNRIKLQLLRKLVRKSLKYDILLLIFSVMFFKTVLENSKAIELVSKAFLDYNVPHFLLVILLPIIIGFITGITIGYVGLAFPLLLPFFKDNLSFFMLAYVSGYIGVLLSPTHLCFSVTQKYFNASYIKVYRSIVPALGAIMCFAVFLVLIGWYRG
jgi:integral membrane protein (TIGR00529 family)